MFIHYINNGSLTSVFTPASSCFATLLDGSEYRLPGQESSARCFPSNLGLYGVRQTAAYFSPGRCPASYTAFTVTTALSTAPGEYVYNCCPLNLTVDAAAERGCRSSWTESTSITYSVYDRMIGTIGPAMTTTVTDNFPATFDGYSIQVRFRNSDISALNLKEPDISALGIGGTTSATSTLNNLTSGSSITTSLTSTPTLPAATTKGLSQGARVAIGVVIPTFLTSLCFGIFLYFRRRKMKERSSQNLQPRRSVEQLELDGTARHEADGRIAQPFMQPHELDSAQLIEADPDPDGSGLHIETISESSNTDHLTNSSTLQPFRSHQAAFPTSPVHLRTLAESPSPSHKPTTGASEEAHLPFNVSPFRCQLPRNDCPPKVSRSALGRQDVSASQISLQEPDKNERSSDAPSRSAQGRKRARTHERWTS